MHVHDHLVVRLTDVVATELVHVRSIQLPNGSTTHVEYISPFGESHGVAMLVIEILHSCTVPRRCDNAPG